jgi:restriction endonuclease S subunit
LLYNDTDRYATDTIAAAVRFAFDNKQIELPEPQNKYCAYINTHDMVDFSRTSFNKAIKLTADKKIEIKSKWSLVKLGDIAEVLKGKSITSAQTKEGNVKVIAGGTDYAYLHNEANRPANTITISASGANAGFVNFWREPIFASDCTTVRGKNDLHTFFLYNFLLSIQNQIFYLQKGSAQPHVYPDDLKQIQIPDVDENVQQQVVSECEKVDEEYNNSRMTIEEYKRKIAEVFERLEVISKSGGVKINKLAQIIKLSSGKMLSNKNRIKGTIPVYGGNGITGYHNEGFIHTPTIVIGRVGEYCGSVHLTESEAWITDNALYATNYLLDINKKFLFYVLKQSNLNQYANRTGQPNISQATIANVKIPYPNIEEQNNIVSEIESYESKIAAAKAEMEGCTERKKKILEKWLR